MQKKADGPEPPETVPLTLPVRKGVLLNILGRPCFMSIAEM